MENYAEIAGTKTIVRLSQSDWDDVADLCEQAASSCENRYEDHTLAACDQASAWFRKLAIRAQGYADAAGIRESKTTYHAYDEHR